MQQAGLSRSSCRDVANTQADRSRAHLLSETVIARFGDGAHYGVPAPIRVRPSVGIHANDEYQACAARRALRQQLEEEK
jgi:hypothetical protein